MKIELNVKEVQLLQNLLFNCINESRSVIDEYNDGTNIEFVEHLENQLIFKNSLYTKLADISNLSRNDLMQTVEKVIEIENSPNKVFLFEVEVGEVNKQLAHEYLLKIKELVNAQGITNAVFTQTRNGIGSFKITSITKPEGIEINSII